MKEEVHHYKSATKSLAGQPRYGAISETLVFVCCVNIWHSAIGVDRSTLVRGRWFYLSHSQIPSQQPWLLFMGPFVRVRKCEGKRLTTHRVCPFIYCVIKCFLSQSSKLMSFFLWKNCFHIPHQFEDNYPQKSSSTIL